MMARTRNAIQITMTTENGTYSGDRFFFLTGAALARFG